MSDIEVITGGLDIPSADIDAVANLPCEIDQAWMAGDAVAFGALFDEHAAFKFSFEHGLYGKQAIQQHWAENVFPGMQPNTQHISTMTRMHFVMEKVAVADGSIRVYLPATEDQEELVTTHIAYTSIGVKRAKRWLIADVRFYPIS